MLVKIRSIFSLFRIALQGTEKNFTSGNVNRATFLLSVPTMLELSMESLFVLVDLLFVSSLGENAITVVGITNSVVILIQSVAMGLSIAATAMISRRVGEQKPRRAGQTAMQVIYLGIFLSVICSVLAVIFNQEIMRFAGGSDHLVSYGNAFSKTMFAGLIFMIMRILINGVFRGSGDASMAMRTLAFSNVLNGLLCAVLIFGLGPFPKLGLLGAAIAMVIANAFSVSYQLWYLFKNNETIIIGKRQMLMVPVLMKRILKLATAGMIQNLVPSSSRFLMIVIVAKLGENVLAGYIIANRIIMFSVLPAYGIANAAGVLTGQNLGARQPERAEASVWKTGTFNMCFLGLIAIFLMFYAKTLAGFFTHDEQILSYASTYLQYMAIAYFFFGYTMVISRALNAAGSVNTVTVLYILMFYMIQLPLSYLLGTYYEWGPKGIFIAILISEIVLATSSILVFRTGKWKTVKL
ncbi:MATE family efflux transporter [Flavobacterium sp. 140616W15]|uniref:MATE family efflux transporter n=1 Tax=Flavobacterium sp. 140616W15 TaxID=2478552 RepID=UPI001F5C1237|nr:MATE family efflux transporter [Flavobacterium sp. 140616W15]